MKRRLNLAIAALIISIFASCESEDIIPVARGDAFIVTKIIDTDTLYALSLHANANAPMASVTATSEDEDDGIYTLSPDNTNTYDFFYEPEEEDFSTDIPTIGEYNFIANFQTDDADLSTDILTDDVIYPAKVTTVSFVSSMLNIEWENDDSIDTYIIALYNEDGNIIFASSPMSGQSHDYQIYADLYGWANNIAPTAGSTYKLQVNTYQYEAGKVGINLQARSIYEKSIIWED